MKQMRQENYKERLMLAGSVTIKPEKYVLLSPKATIVNSASNVVVWELYATYKKLKASLIWIYQMPDVKMIRYYSGMKISIFK
jgi:hypothetical protein